MLFLIENQCSAINVLSVFIIMYLRYPNTLQWLHTLPHELAKMSTSVALLMS